VSVHYTKDHEWIALDADGVGTVGITHYAQVQLGDVVFVELPEVGTSVALEGQTGVVESVKAASEIYAPCAGEIVDANARLEEDPSLINSAPEGAAWIYKIKVADPSSLDGLMDQAAYAAHVAALEA